jgi:hypothetical protein
MFPYHIDTQITVGATQKSMCYLCFDVVQKF